VDRVIGIFNALLRLAEIDTARASGFVQVDLAKIASEAAEFYQPVAEIKGITLTFTSSGELAWPGILCCSRRRLETSSTMRSSFAQEKADHGSGGRTVGWDQ